MRLDRLSIINFKNIESEDLSLSAGINCFVGDNGAGKTNILESIYVLAITKSHRAYIDKNLINNSKNIIPLN